WARVRTVVAAAMLAYMLAWSAGDLQDSEAPLGRASAPGVALGLDAAWSMFAPDPARDSGWFVLPGQLADGTEVDVLPAFADFEGAPGPLGWEKPLDVYATFGGSRRLDYLGMLTEKDQPDLWAALAAWACRGWNAAHAGEHRLSSFTIDYVLDEVPV